MGALWSFLRDPNNRTVLSWLGGGLVVVIGGAWTLFKYVSSSASRAAKSDPEVRVEPQIGPQAVQSKHPLELGDFYGILDHQSVKQRRLLREIIKSDNRVDGKVFSSFFQLPNRVGGQGDYMYLPALAELVGLSIDETRYRCQQLEDSRLVEFESLTLPAYRAPARVIELVNAHYSTIIPRLYTPEELVSTVIPTFYGGVTYQDGSPHLFFDLDRKPLNGILRFRDSSFLPVGLYRFKDGVVEATVDPTTLGPVTDV